MPELRGAPTALLGMVLVLASTSAARAQTDGQNGEKESDEQSDEQSGEQDSREGGADIEQEARVHFRLGRAYYDSGRFEQAAQEFETAYELSGRTKLLYNLFLAWRDAGKLAKAIDALESYLEQGEDISQRAKLEARLESMRRLRRQQQGERSGDSDGDGGDTPPDGGEPTGEDAEASEPTGEDGHGDAADASDGDAGGSTGGGSTGGGSNGSADGGGGSPLAWVVMASGAAVLASGAVTGGLALSAESELESTCTPTGDGNYRCPADSGFAEDKDRGNRLATATDVLLITGALTTGAGLALFFLLNGDDNIEHRRRTRGGVACSNNGCLGTVRVPF